MNPFQSIKSYRKRNQYLLGIALVGLLLIYWVSLRPTLELYGKCQTLREEEQRAAAAPMKINRYQKQLAGLMAGTPQPYQREQLLEKVTAFCRANDLLITSFPEAGRSRRSNYTVLTHEIEVEGRYKEMVELVYMLEQQEVLGVVSSLKFHSFKDRITKKRKLSVRVILRNLEA